jgi:hypothetical protein
VWLTQCRLTASGRRVTTWQTALTGGCVSPRLSLMVSAALRFVLNLCCFVVLLLPAGWCRSACARAPVAKQEAPKGDKGGFCHSCPCKAPEKPVPRQAPSCPQCCCNQPDWLKPSGPQKITAAFSLPATITPPPSSAPSTTLRSDLDLSIPGPCPPLHVLKCVWLC